MAVAERLRAFAHAHGLPAEAVVSYLGRSVARIVVVAADGLFDDAVVAGTEVAAAVCEQAALPVQGWTRELTGRITLSPADRRRMAGTGR